VTQGSPSPATSEVANLVVPKEATGGSYQLKMSFPAFAGPPLGGVTLTTPAIAYNASAATVAATWNAVTTGAGAGRTVAVTGTNFNAGVADGDYTLTFNNAFANTNVPDIGTVDPQVGNLATTMISDGSIANSKRAAGGRDPSITTISDLGGGIYASTGTMSAGPVGGVAGKNTGKSGFYSDTQYTFIQYPAALVTAINSNLAQSGAIPILSAITGLPASQLSDNCSLSGLLTVFCVANAAVIPAMFSGLCATVLDKESGAPNAPTSVVAAAGSVGTVNLTWTAPTIGNLSGTGPGGSTRYGPISGYATSLNPPGTTYTATGSAATNKTVSCTSGNSVSYTVRGRNSAFSGLGIDGATSAVSNIVTCP